MVLCGQLLQSAIAVVAIAAAVVATAAAAVARAGAVGERRHISKR